jgi:predicted peptidase
VISVLAGQTAMAELVERIMRVAGTTVHYKVVLPDGYEPAKAYPAVLVMGGGPQTMNTVDGTLDRNFRTEAERRGYVIVAPAAPDGELFFQGGERIFPEFLEAILANYKIADGKFHVAGPSNCGIAALHAPAHPQYFLSATAFAMFGNRQTRNCALRLCVFAHRRVRRVPGATDAQRVEFLGAQGAVALYRGPGATSANVGGANAAGCSRTKSNKGRLRR